MRPLQITAMGKAVQVYCIHYTASAETLRLFLEQVF